MGAGVSQPVGFRWFQEAGGMSPSHLSPSSGSPSGRCLCFAERGEIALWRAQGLGVREIARRLGRSGSAVSRELRRGPLAGRQPGRPSDHHAVACWTRNAQAEFC